MTAFHYADLQTRKADVRIDLYTVGCFWQTLSDTFDIPMSFGYSMPQLNDTIIIFVK